MLPLEGSPGKWELRNACIVYRVRNSSAAMPRPNLYGAFAHWKDPISARIFSRNGVSAEILGFSEMRGFRSGGVIRTEAEAGELDLDRCDQRAVGLVVFLANNNFYHLNFHIVTTFESLRAHVGPEAILLPWFGRLSTDREPLTAPKMNAWEYSVRALTPASTKVLVSDLHRLFREPLQQGAFSCTCAGRLVGDTGAFEPRAVGARIRWAAFTKAALSNSRFLLGLPATTAPPRSPRITYVSRDSTRRIINEADVLRIVFELSPRARLAKLETMTVAEQMVLIASSSIFMAAHGAALAWLPFLAGAQERAACIEVLIPHHAATYKSKSMYGKFARAMGIHYQSIDTDFANRTRCPGTSKRERWINECNLNAKLGGLKTKVQGALDFIRNRSSTQGVWCAGFLPCKPGQATPAVLVESPVSTGRPVQLPMRHDFAEILRGSPGKWELPNACVAYHRNRQNVTSVQFISRNDLYARIEGFAGSKWLGPVATVRPMAHAAELDGCGRHTAGRAVVVGDPRAEEEGGNSLLLPLGSGIPGMAREMISWRTQGALDHLLRVSCLCFEIILGDTGPSPVVQGH